MGLEKLHTLKELRKERGLTQKQCAYYVGITNRTYRNWECGESVIPSDKFKRLADYFGITLNELFIACFDSAEKEGSNGN